MDTNNTSCVYLPTSHQKVVFAAMSKKTFFLREFIVKFVLEQNCTPTCAFMMFSYFLLDTINRTGLINATNALILKSDELWVFGPISDGVACEIELAKSLQLPIKCFDIAMEEGISFLEIPLDKAQVEDDAIKARLLMLQKS